MEPRLTALNENEILKYLGYRSQPLTEEFMEQLRICEQKILDECQPRFIYRIFDYADAKVEGIEIPGNDIKNLLAECKEVVLFGATIGNNVERLISRTEKIDMADAFIMDACASTAIENLCNNFEEDFRREVESRGKYLTDRFSPGYGDLPLEFQKTLTGMIDMSRRIGVSLSGTLLMTPRKSVTAIMGVSDFPVEHRESACEVCMMFQECSFRKHGVTCRGEQI